MAKHSKSVNSQISRLNVSKATVQQENMSAEKLRTEKDFANYLRKLKLFAQKYCVIVVACDTPWGPPITQELTKLMMSVGFKENLYGKFRCAYSAVIDSGKLVFERLENDIKQYIDESVTLSNGDKIQLLSSGYNSSLGKLARIQVNDIILPGITRALYFVIYDKNSKTLLDVVGFDTYDGLKCDHLIEYYEGVKTFLSENPGVLPIGYFFPSNVLNAYTKNEEMILATGLDIIAILQNSDKPISILSRNFDKQGIEEVLSAPVSYYDYRGYRRFEDKHGKHVNIINGHRVTSFQPDTIDKNTICIYILGNCKAFGVGNSDEYTMPSILQRMLNDASINAKVVNYGTFLSGLGEELNSVKINLLNSLPVKPGDIIFIQDPLGFSQKDIPIINMTGLFLTPHTEDYYYDISHFTPAGNRMIAEKLFEALTSRGVLDKAQQLANVHFTGGGGTNCSELRQGYQRTAC